MRSFSLRGMLSLVLAFLLLLGSLPARMESPPAAPSRLFGGRLLDSDEKLLAAAELHETLYLLSSEAFYELKPGDQQPRRVAGAKPAREDKGYQEGEYNVIFSHQEQLYGLNLELGLLYELTVGADSVQAALRHKLDVRGLKLGEGRYAYIYPRCIYAHEGRLFIIAQAKRTNDNNCYSYDLQTGKLKKHKSTKMRAVTAYQDGLLLTAYHNPKIKLKDDGSNYWVLGLFDPAKDTIKPVDWVPEDAMNGVMGNFLYYDAARDRLLTFSDTDLFRIDGAGQRERLLSLPVGDFYFFPLGAETPGLLPLSGDRLLISLMKESFIRPLNPAQQAQEVELVLSHPLPDSKAFQKALLQMDGIIVRTIEGSYAWTEQELATKLLTDTLEADILVLDSSRYDVQALMRKGYLSPLEDQAAFRAHAEGLTPSLQPLMKDEAGKLLALPLQVSLGTLRMQLNNAAEAGLTAPGHLPALLDMVQAWADSDDGRHDGFLLASFAPIKPELKRLAHAAYMDAMLSGGGELRYDMEGFGSLMQRIDQLQLQGIDFASLEDLDDQAGTRKPIFFESGSYHLRQMSGEQHEQPLLLPIQPGAELHISGSASLAGIYARSRKQEAAARFLQAYLAHMDPLDRAMMNPSQVEAIENPDHEKEMAKQQAWEDGLRLQIAEAKGAEKRQLEQDLSYAEAIRAQRTEQARWLATAEALRLNHQLMARVFFPQGLALTQQQAMVGEDGLFHSFLRGGLSLEQFISRANDMLRMLRLEAR